MELMSQLPKTCIYRECDETCCMLGLQRYLVRNALVWSLCLVRFSFLCLNTIKCSREEMETENLRKKGSNTPLTHQQIQCKSGQLHETWSESTTRKKMRLQQRLGNSLPLDETSAFASLLESFSASHGGESDMKQLRLTKSTKRTIVVLTVCSV